MYIYSIYIYGVYYEIYIYIYILYIYIEYTTIYIYMERLLISSIEDFFYFPCNIFPIATEKKLYIYSTLRYTYMYIYYDIIRV